LDARFALATIDEGGGPAPVIRIGDRLWRLADEAPGLFALQAAPGLMALFRDWDRSLAALQGLAGRLSADPGAPARALDATRARYLTPLQWPAKVMCTGTNYHDHLRAVGRTSFNKTDNCPAFFMKPPTTALVGPGPVRHPPGATQFDWEIELAVVIGRTARSVSVEDALGHVAAYAIGLDLSARDLQKNPRHFAKMDLCLGKAFDDSCPLGPLVVPARFVGDPQQLWMKLWVEGVLEQDSGTRHMIWSVAEQIADLTRLITLEPGDVLLTGTPAGTGIETGRYLKRGDRIDAEIEHLGRLEVHVV
jgi:2-keto-4-pentenoate hydratase/2-oxohepta-3-ene-1,7-dioic acid hydratase in catechol pathway